MTDSESISRRDVLRGKMLKGLFGREKASSDKESAGQDQAPSGSIMRYPKAPDDLSPATPTARRYRRSIPLMRPPGAVDEASFLRDCTRCGDCIEACPHDAIILAPEQMREAAGTPTIDPSSAPCRMCDDFPCIGACEPGVLRSDLPVMMGTARIIEETCLAHQGSFCTVCSEQCPVGGAITLEAGKPSVVEEACTGCGVCRHVCPAPENAVLLMPTFSRPSPPGPEATS